jgi:DUF971 family protein
MKPKRINVKDKSDLSIVWQDAKTTNIPLKYLRDECPCAGCKGETILFKTYRPPKPTIFSEEMYKITNIDVVGDYAIQITWNDGHNTGIYSWEYLITLEAGMNDSKEQNYNRLI